jgi:SAM-dependent methyltransferase
MGSASVQGELWGAAAEDWADLQDPQSRPLWTAMLDALQVAPGSRFLDAGCGAGGASLLAAERGAQVSGIDASKALIAIAWRRMPAGDFQTGDLETLPYSDGAFDCVVACNSVQYAADPIAALRELRRVCAPSGQVAVAIWSPPELCDMRVVFQAVREALPPSTSGGGPLPVAPGVLEGMMQQAGLTVSGGGEVDCPFEYPDEAIFWRAMRSAGVIQEALRVAGDEQLRSSILGAVRPYRTPAGGFRLENRFRYLIAARD